ncbi:MAG: hypothetical protein WC935_00060 [Thermoleophilia bacterium]
MSFALLTGVATAQRAELPDSPLARHIVNVALINDVFKHLLCN